MTTDPMLNATDGERPGVRAERANARPPGPELITPELFGSGQIAPDSGAAGQIAFIGLGSNLADPQRQIEQALTELATLPQTCLRAASRLYRTAPVGPLVASPGAPLRSQPDFVNAAARLATTLTPAALLLALQQLERRHGRVRDGTRWGPRTLDLDLLLFGDLVQTAASLQLPHPQLHRRAFVLVPLADIAPPTLVVPGQGCLGDLLAAVARTGVEPLAGWQPVDARWADDARTAVPR